MKTTPFPDATTKAVASDIILDYFYPLLPLLALIPNFFIIPSLTYPGLATQELGFAVAVVCVLALAAIRFWRNEQPIRISRRSIAVLAPLALFWLWQFLSLLWAPERGEALRQLGLWFGFFVFVAIAWWSLVPRTAWWIYYSLIVLSSILAISLWLEYRTYGAYEMQGTFFNHGITAELLATMWPLFFCVFLFEKQDRLAIYSSVYAVLVSGGALLLTLRRGPLLGVILAGSLAIGAVMFGKMVLAHRLRMVTVIFVILFVVLPAVVIKREAIMTRLQGATTLKEAPNAEAAELGLTSRAVTWLTAWEMGKARLIRGVGLGGYASRYFEYRRAFVEDTRFQAFAEVAEPEDYDQIRSPMAHSDWLQTFAELGIVGTLFYFAFWIGVIYFCWQCRQARYGHLAFGSLCSLLAFSVSSATNAFGFRLTPSIFLVSSLLAMAWCVRHKLDATQNTKQPIIFSPPVTKGLIAFALIGGLLLLQRTYNVYLSQSAQGAQSLQSVLDFTFSLDSEAANEASVRRYERVLNYDPYNSGAHLGLSVLLFQMKRLPECITHAEQAFTHGYNRPFTFLLRSFAYEHSGEVEKSQEILKTGLASFPKSFVLRAAYAESLRKRGEREAALAQLALLEKRDQILARSWAIAMRYKDEDATKLANEQNLIPPGELKPKLARVLTQARAYHYYRSVTVPNP